MMPNPCKFPHILIKQLFPLWHRDIKKGEAHAKRLGEGSLGVVEVVGFLLLALLHNLFSLALRLGGDVVEVRPFHLGSVKLVVLNGGGCITHRGSGNRLFTGTTRSIIGKEVLIPEDLLVLHLDLAGFLVFEVVLLVDLDIHAQHLLKATQLLPFVVHKVTREREVERE
jgi:hypothetical protein